MQPLHDPKGGTHVSILAGDSKASAAVCDQKGSTATGIVILTHQMDSG